jgi:hypothetical protein
MQKKRFLLIIFSLIIVIVVFMPTIADKAFGWGVMGSSTTHQHILNEAYKLLQADPAFDPLKFPTLEQILRNEGVNAFNIKFTGEGTTGLDASLLEGPGPDSKGNSPYSWHYYNPYTKEGKGPEAVQKYYRYLVQGMLKSQSEVLPKSAAWSAHFLADMHCPYHINGSYRDTIIAIKAKQLAENQDMLSKGAVYLEDAVKGSEKLSYLTPIKSLSSNFRTEIDRFLDTDNDWFDPWYYNGDYFDKLISNTSSHILWEATVSPGDYNLQGYAPGWLNANGAIDKVVAAQEHQAYNLAVKAALHTREQINELFDNPTPAVNEAIRSVYSMWRASFSGMRLDTDIKKDGGFLVATGIITNKGSAALQKVEARLTSAKCEIVSEKKTQELGELQPGARISTQAWRVKTSEEPCKLTMEAVCSSPVPDLQYASTERSFFPEQTNELSKPESHEPKKPEEPRATPVVDAGAKGAWVLVDVQKSDHKTEPVQKNDKWDATLSTAYSDTSFMVNCRVDSFAYYQRQYGVNATYTWNVSGTWDQPPASLQVGSVQKIGCRLDIKTSGGKEVTDRGFGLTGVKISVNASDTFPTCDYEHREVVKSIMIEDPPCIDAEKYGKGKCTENDLTFRIIIEANMRGIGFVPGPWAQSERVHTYKYMRGAGGDATPAQ